MILPLVFSSLLLAAASDDRSDDRMDRFRLLHAMGDLKGAYALLFDAPSPGKDLALRLDLEGSGLLLGELEAWVQQSPDLETLMARLIEYQAAWASCVFFESTSSHLRFQWPLTLQFENTFLFSGASQVPGPFESFLKADFGVPWFIGFEENADPLFRSGFVRGGGYRYRDPGERSPYKVTETARQFRLPGQRFTDRRSVVSVGKRLAVLWSADKDRALIGFVVNDQDQADRSLFQFAIVPHDEVDIR